MKSGAALVLLLLGIAVSQCSKNDREVPPVVSLSASPATSTSAEPSEDSVPSAYPFEGGPPDTLVVRLCQALHDLPEQRRANCCGQKPTAAFTSECVRTLTSAVRLKAVSLEPAEVDRCAAAMSRVHDGCDWVGPWPPETPRECDGIVHGKLAAAARCRSSLECAEGLRCHGLGPTTPGLCGAPHDLGDACGSAVDTLAAFTKQSHADEEHPECKGGCDNARCGPTIPLGGVCRSARQCGDAGCAAGKCTPHATGKVGDACPTGECEQGALCSGGTTKRSTGPAFAGYTCVDRKPTGASCESDGECRGACIKVDGGAKVCGHRCDVR